MDSADLILDRLRKSRIVNWLETGDYELITIKAPDMPSEDELDEMYVEEPVEEAEKAQKPADFFGKTEDTSATGEELGQIPSIYVHPHLLLNTMDSSDSEMIRRKEKYNRTEPGRCESVSTAEEEPAVQIKIKQLPKSRNFDTKKVLERLKELHADWNTLHRTDNRIWKLGWDKAAFSTNNEYFEDIIMFCITYTFRGTALYRVMETSHDEYRSILMHLANKYNIAKMDATKGTWYPADAITLERIVRCHPAICCDLYAEYKYLPLVDDDVIGVNLRPPMTAMLCPLFPSVACANLLKKGTNILPELLWIAYKVDETITNNLLDLACLWANLMTSINLILIPEEAKVEFCKKWNLVTQKGNPVGEFEDSRIRCLNNLEEVYSDHEDWMAIRATMDTYQKETLDTYYNDRCHEVREDLRAMLGDELDKEPSYTDIDAALKKVTLKRRSTK